MASLQASFLLPSSRKTITQASIHVPKLPNLRISVPRLPKTSTASLKLIEELCLNQPLNIIPPTQSPLTSHLHAILDIVADRVEMHNNICQQRDNWNSLFLNSINMITLAASVMAATAPAVGALGAPLLGLKLSSALLFSAATGMLVMVNKIQPSQLAEEQRNAARLFKQLQTQIQTLITVGAPTQRDVDSAMEKVLALDKAYPLPLLGVMLEKFPKKLEPASWWPNSSHSDESKTQNENAHFDGNQRQGSNGWSDQLEAEMREVVEVMKTKDAKDYVRLGNLVLKVNKTLAISGPLLTGIAALGSAFVGDWSSGGMVVAAAAGSLAAAVNALEHGGQIGMVFEMYRNSAGFFGVMEESIRGTLEETDWEKRENGQVFERKVALKLGRSLSQLRQLAAKSAAARQEGISIDEFASKLF
ncbi:probable F-box protein At4g22030 [Cucurbita pepo subsp. pepo]|uniref:probable F-box protein At4g22030 n=1 Tax=Cucurbita pepo subsp. pepo TaxID=3664 RepID=UPI000C9D5B07|nr:probable F-box protein At4g22030 [Cucurbita pepo subsp. pepo]